jgi:hypothetical protein
MQLDCIHQACPHYLKMPAHGKMVAKQDRFSAAASAADYYHQARLALGEALRFAYAESGIEVAIEAELLVAIAQQSNNATLLRNCDLSTASAARSYARKPS